MISELQIAQTSINITKTVRSHNFSSLDVEKTGGPTQLVPITPWNFRSALALIGNKRFFPFVSFFMVLIAVC